MISETNRLLVLLSSIAVADLLKCIYTHGRRICYSYLKLIRIPDEARDIGWWLFVSNSNFKSDKHLPKFVFANRNRFNWEINELSSGERSRNKISINDQAQKLMSPKTSWIKRRRAEELLGIESIRGMKILGSLKGSNIQQLIKQSKIFWFLENELT